MKKAEQRKQCPILFAYGSKKLNFQNFIMDSHMQKHFKDNTDTELAQLQKYGHQYYLGSSGYSNKLSKYSDSLTYSLSDYDQLSKQEPIRLFPQFFDDVYYSRCVHPTEVQNKRVNEPYKYFSQEALMKKVRFCDMFQYIDTLTVDLSLVADSKQFFEIMANVTEGQAFTNRCRFNQEPKVGVHLIDTPNWFCSEKFNPVSMWIACILEENLWAHFTLHEQKTSKNFQDKTGPNIDYLFEFKEFQITKETQQLISIQKLTDTWLNAPQENKNEVTDSILKHKTITQMLALDPQRRLKDIYLKCDFFISDFNSDIVISDSDTQNLVDRSIKLSNKQKQQQTFEFIQELFMSPLTNIEHPKDILNRHLLKLIIEMHQDLLIQELIGSNKQQSSKRDKKRNKKSKKVDRIQENRDTVNNNINFDQNMETPQKQRSFDQRKQRREVQKSKETLSYESFQNDDHSAISLHTCKDIEVSDHDQLIFKDALDDEKHLEEEPDPIHKEQLKIDMMAVSNSYIADMFLKIEQEIKEAQKHQERSMEAPSQKTKSKKKKRKTTNPSKQESDSNPLPPIQEDQKLQVPQQMTEMSSLSQFKSDSSKKLKVQKHLSSLTSKHQNEDNLLVRQDSKQKQQVVQEKKESSSKNLREANNAVGPDGGEQLSANLVKASKIKQKKMMSQIQEIEKPAKLIDIEPEPKMISQPFSRNHSTENQNNPEQSEKTPGARKRNRKKNKNQVDPEEAMNQFIQQLNAKKESWSNKQSSTNDLDRKKKFGQKPTQTQSRKSSESRQKTKDLLSQQTKDTLEPSSSAKSLAAKKQSSKLEKISKTQSYVGYNNLGAELPDLKVETPSLYNIFDVMKNDQTSKTTTMVNEKVSELTLNKSKPESPKQLAHFLTVQKAKSEINTNSPSFQPKQKAKDLQTTQDFSVNQQNSSIEQMAFNLNNVKSFNPQQRDYNRPRQQYHQGFNSDVNRSIEQPYTHNVINISEQLNYNQQMGIQLQPSFRSENYSNEHQHGFVTSMPAVPNANSWAANSDKVQMNSFNINVFGNLNIGSIVSNQLSSAHEQMINESNIPLLNMQVMDNRAFNQIYDYNLQQTIEFKFYEKFDIDIYDEVNRIQQKIDLVKEERNYVLQKLQEMCEKVFYKPSNENDDPSQIPKIMQFGSLMTGLALTTSDMDMAVTNLFLPDRQKMIDCLDLFADQLRKWDIIQDLNAISTASIPVIKGNINLKLLREKEMINVIEEVKVIDFAYTQSDIMPKESKRASSKEKQELTSEQELLKIDITFVDNMSNIKTDLFAMPEPNFFFINQKSHQGLASSQLIKFYVEHYKCLKEVSIILKQFLARMDLNSPYHGGISSYSTVLLLVAYMNKWNLKMSSSLTPSRLLMGFLDYYSYYFNAGLFGIDVTNNGSFYELSSPETNFVILDPLNVQDNTTRSSFLTHEIIKSFRKAFNSLKNQLLQYQQAKNSNFKENLVDLILQRQTTQQPVV